MNLTKLPLFVISILLFAGCGKPTEEKAEIGIKDLKITDVKVGEGRPAEDGDLLLVQYTGTLKNGSVFDTNTTPGREPFPIYLGQGAVIAGWDQGLVGVKRGGVRKLEIPYRLAYGEQGQPPQIPPRTDLYFEIKVLDLVKKDEMSQIEIDDVKAGTGREATDGSTVTINLKGTLIDGRVVESKHEKEPLTFTLGAQQVWPFAEASVKGMREGGIRKVRVPPDAGFGRQGGPSIPPNNVLLFEFKLLKVK